MSLVDVLNHLEAVDGELEKEAEEFDKLAAEEEAAGRIMARGFMDELNKLAQFHHSGHKGLMSESPYKAKPKTLKGGGAYGPGGRPTGIFSGRAAHYGKKGKTPKNIKDSPYARHRFN